MPPRPSLRALRAFAEVCRAGGVAPAARALGVSPSAVSHLLRELERTLGVALFAAPGRPGAPLTEAGERLRAGLGSAFDGIDAAVAEAVRRSGEVRVSALSTFSELWLVPRLGRLRSALPELRLLLAAETRMVDLATEPYDCAIRNGRGAYPGLEVTALFRERLVAVANPRLLGEAGCLERLPRIAARSRPKDWPHVLRALGLPPELPPAMVLETRALAVRAALAGLGAAVIDRHLVEDLIAARMLAVTPPDTGVDLPDGFFFVARAEKLRDKYVRGLRDWLAAEAAAR